MHIRIISEGSCDTEDWSNGCWKFSFALQEYILKYTDQNYKRSTFVFAVCVHRKSLRSLSSAREKWGQNRIF